MGGNRYDQPHKDHFTYDPNVIILDLGVLFITIRSEPRNVLIIPDLVPVGSAIEINIAKHVSNIRLRHPDVRVSMDLVCASCGSPDPVFEDLIMSFAQAKDVEMRIGGEAGHVPVIGREVGFAVKVVD